jgi:hypothetical protein
MPARGDASVSRRAFLTGVPAVLLGRAAAAAVAPPSRPEFSVQPIVEPRRPGAAVHLVLAAEGFREAERATFLKHAERYATEIRAQEPFAAVADRLRVSVAWAASRDSGIPQVLEHDVDSGRWRRRPSDRQTVFQTTLHAGRYMIEVGDYHAIRAVWAASPDPVDNLIVVVNEPGYGGGARAAVDMPAAAYHAHTGDAQIPYDAALKTFTFGLTVVSCDAKLGGRVLIHELGHSFADLGEEYFHPTAAFQPVPNHPSARKPNVSLTADPGRVKWKDLIGTDRVGVFEGAEGFGRGLFRPWDDGCVMRRPEHGEFCPVCRRAVEAELRGVLGRRPA